MGVTLERRRIMLGKPARGPFATDFLVLDCDGKTVRAVHYRLRHPQEHPDPRWTPDEQVFRLGQELGWFDERSDRQAWVRTAGQAATLGRALESALERSRHEPRATEAYVRSTGWGAGLP